MIITNKTKGWITINDLKVSVPPAGRGNIAVPDATAAKSIELATVVRQGLVDIGRDPRETRPIEVGGLAGHAVPAKTIWEGHGPRPQEFREKDYKESASPPAAAETPRLEFEDKRQYRIRRLMMEASISFEGPRVSLSRLRPEALLDAKGYHDPCVQKALMERKIELIELLEPRIGPNGLVQMVSVRKDESLPKDVLARAGSACVFWEGPIFDGGGYANMNRQYVFHLTEMGFTVKPTILSTLMDVEEPIQKRLMELNKNLIPPNSPKVYATNVPGRSQGRCISYTMMETENRIHPTLVTHVSAADEVWVPCDWNRDLFVSSGVKKDIRVMPLGVDDKMFYPAPRTVVYDPGPASFTFISVFNWNWRKGFDVMLRAYIRAFTAKDDVALVMVSRFVGQTKMSAQIFKDIAECTVSERQGDRPRLLLVDEVILTFLMPRLYNSADAFVLLSRGEGFGLPALEAAASGVPLLTCDHGGHRMFLDSSVATLVTPDRVRRVDKTIEWISPFYHDMEFVDYSEKAIDETAEKMRWMVAHRAEIAEKAELCRQRVVGQFTWRHAAERVGARIKEIQP